MGKPKRTWRQKIDIAIRAAIDFESGLITEDNLWDVMLDLRLSSNEVIALFFMLATRHKGVNNVT